MPTETTSPEEMLPLTPAVFHILLALAEEERHGYSIMQQVAETTEGRVKMGAGTLYGTIKRLLKAKLIEKSDERPDPALEDERRVYYRLTGFGRRVLSAELSRYSKAIKVARKWFGGRFLNLCSHRPKSCNSSCNGGKASARRSISFKIQRMGGRLV
ncbi:MAG TPA: PadR family transcriptional regulator [Verrucomicrobiae bacterium]|nr:PadR family transcriptional regulator [Verrucomicrobiae bacterium]